MKKIKIANKPTKIAYVFLWILGIILVGLLIYNHFVAHLYNLGVYNAVFALISIISLLMIGTFNPNVYFPKGTIKHLLIDYKSITIVPMNNKLDQEIIIKKSDILNFNVNIKINEKYLNQKINISTTYLKIVIKLKNEQEYIYETLIRPTLWKTSYEFVYELLKYSYLIPNFSINTSSSQNSDILAKIEYFKKYGHKRPFWKSPGWLANHIITRIFIIIFVLLMIFASLYCLSFLGNEKFAERKIPITKEEKKYLVQYDKALTTKNIVHDCGNAIKQFEKAESIINYSADSHLQKAYCYQYLNEYSNALSEAQLALKYIGNRAISDKYYLHPLGVNKSSFNHTSYEKIQFLLGDIYYEIENYENAIDAYLEGLKQIDNQAYIDEYLRLGLSYLGIQDFVNAEYYITKHKNIVETCMENGRYNGRKCLNYNEKYFMTIENLIKICETKTVIKNPKFPKELKEL